MTLYNTSLQNYTVFESDGELKSMKVQPSKIIQAFKHLGTVTVPRSVTITNVFWFGCVRNLLYLLFLIGIICIAIYYDEAYFYKEPPTGYIASTLAWNTSMYGSQPNITSNYCDQNILNYSNIDCHYWKAYDVLYPTIEDSSMFITTYVKEWEENYNSTLSIWVCNDSTIKEKFIPLIENYQIELQHAVRTASFAISITENTQVKQAPIIEECASLRIKNPNCNNSVTLSNDNGIKCNPSDLWNKYDNVTQSMGGKYKNVAIGDIITVKDILNITCLNLDRNNKGLFEPNIYNETTIVEQNLRIRGISIIFSIRYNNIYFNETVTYKYRARAIDVYERPVEIFPIVYNLKRMVRERSGLRINFLLTGELGQGNYFSLLSKIGSYISFIVIVSIILWFIQKYVIHCYPCYCPKWCSCCLRYCPECYNCCSEYSNTLKLFSTFTEDLELRKKNDLELS